MTSKTHGPSRRNSKSEYQECTCKMDNSLNGRMFNEFESRKICVAGYQCDNSDFVFCIAEQSELPVIKICSDDGRDDCQQLKPKGTEASIGTTVITATILFIISISFSRVAVIVQWNPVNTTTFGPWKFGRINGVGSNYGAKCF